MEFLKLYVEGHSVNYAAAATEVPEPAGASGSAAAVCDRGTAVGEIEHATCELRKFLSDTAELP